VSRFRGPVRRKGDRYVIDIGADEQALITRLIGELRALLTEPDPSPQAQQLLARLFPVAYPDDAEKEVEYQRLMRDELVQSKLASFDIVDDALTGQAPLDEGRLVAVMQAVNSIRLVLGNMLDVTDDPAIDEVDDEIDDSPEYALYSYLSWLLEWCVRALT
jgi:hypothetical protein